MLSQQSNFKLLKTSEKARKGVFKCHHGSFETPNFMPVGTQGCVKGLCGRDLKELGAQVILANTYHLHLRPGDELIKNHGGLHKFMNWSGPILTDSGGFQVYSLANLTKITDDGAEFRSHIDGSKVFFSPKKVVKIQENLGVDIMMVLDECLAFGATYSETKISLDRTVSWAKASLEARERPESQCFGILQGGFEKSLRLEAIERMLELKFDGYALGGLSVGEPGEMMREVIGYSLPKLPENQIRYVMGVGYPHDIVDAVAEGVDLFDCVIPTRSARFGRVFTKDGFFNIKNKSKRDSNLPLEEGCQCYTCQNFSRAYISHLIHAKEMLSSRLLTIHNLYFYQKLLADIRASIEAGVFEGFRRDVLAVWADFMKDNNQPKKSAHL